MPAKKRGRTPAVAGVKKEAATEGPSAKKVRAKQQVEGDAVDMEQAVSRLEERVSRGDAPAMLALARCCAQGRGTQQNAKRAEELVSNAAAKGKKEAQYLLELIHEWEGLEVIDLSGLKEECSKQLKQHHLNGLS